MVEKGIPTEAQHSPGTEAQHSTGTEAQHSPGIEARFNPGTEDHSTLANTTAEAQHSTDNEAQHSPGIEAQFNPGTEDQSSSANTTTEAVSVLHIQGSQVEDHGEAVIIGKQEFEIELADTVETERNATMEDEAGDKPTPQAITAAEVEIMEEVPSSNLLGMS